MKSANCKRGRRKGATSKIVKRCQKVFRQFSRRAKKRQKSSKHVKKFFDTFRQFSRGTFFPAPFGGLPWSGRPRNSTETQKELKWPKSDSRDPTPNWTQVTYLGQVTVIYLLMGLFRGAVFRHGGGALKQPIKQPTETPTSTLALMGRFPSLMGRFPTLMGRFTDFVRRGRFTSWKSTGKQPIKKRGIKRFLRLWLKNDSKIGSGVTFESLLGHFCPSHFWVTCGSLYCRDQNFSGSGKIFPGINFWKITDFLREKPRSELIIVSSNFQALLLL